MSFKITIFGVGGAPINAIKNMANSHLTGCQFAIFDRDVQFLRKTQFWGTVVHKNDTSSNIELERIAAEENIELGRIAAEKNIEEIMSKLKDSDMVLVTAGMGGSIGTGATPVIAQAARGIGIFTVGVVTKPFSFEGTHRMKLAEAGIERLQKHVDMLIIIPNQNLLRIGIEKMTILDTFKKADEALQSGVRCVTDLIVMRGQMIPPSADIHAVMAEIGTAVIGIGEAVGEHRSVKAPKAAITSPLLNDVSTKCTMLVNIIGGFDMTPFDINNVIECIHNETMFVIDIINDRLLEGINKNNIIFRSTFDKSMEGRMRVSIIATNEEQEISNNKLQNLIVEDNTAPSSFKIIAPANTPDEELAELISHLSNIYSSVGGDELKISKVRDLPSNTSSCKQSILQRKWLVK